MITKHERTVLDLAAALAAQMMEAEDRSRRETKHDSDEGTDLRRLRNTRGSRGNDIRTLDRFNKQVDS